MSRRKYPTSNYIRILFRQLRVTRANCEAYFIGTNASYDMVMTSDGEISITDMAQIYRNAQSISGQQDLGLLIGAQLDISTHGPLGVAAYNGPDLKTALKLFAKYSQTRAQFFTVSIKERAEGISVIFTEAIDLNDIQHFVYEAALMGLFASINAFVGEGNFDGRVQFAYDAPTHEDQYRQYFGGDISFGQATTEILVSKRILATPSPVADDSMYQNAIAICDQQLAALRLAQQPDSGLLVTETVTETVTAILHSNLGKLLTAAEVASQLHISARTLIRQLDAEGTKFLNVRDEVIKSQALKHLIEANLSVDATSHLLGFSDASSFRRSFKRWFGETPSQYLVKVRETAE